jgi:hypothetical protein
VRTTQIGPGAARVEGMSPLGRAPIATRRSRMPFRLGDARTSEVQVHNSSDRQRVSATAFLEGLAPDSLDLGAMARRRDE